MTLIANAARLLRPLLDAPYVRRTRRNHGLEHATIHMLNRQNYRLSGRSFDSGFVLLGDVPTEKVEAAVHEALRRMRRGEHGLALHPNCGTNLATTGLLATVVGAAGFGGRGLRTVFDRFSLVMVLMMGVVLLAQPLGMSLQRHITTEGDPGDLEVTGVSRQQMQFPFGGPPLIIHRIETRRG